MTLVAQKPLSYALRENARVISALVVRSAVTRFGEGRLGFIWVLAEPAAYIGIFLLIHTSLKAHIPFGDNAMLFILAGVFGFRMTRGISRKTEKAISNNQPMLTYPLVRPLDTLIATFLLESTVWLIICALFMSGLAISLDRDVIVYPGEFAEAMFAILYFAFSFAAFNAVASTLVPRYSTFISMLSMPLMLMSGVFFMPAEMPPEFQAVLWWNPFLHCVEWFRTSTYLDYNALLSRTYLLSVSSVFLASALVMERLFRRKIVSG